MTASAQVSTGRFWKVLGRIMLLSLGLAALGTCLRLITSGYEAPLDQQAMVDSLEALDGDSVIENLRFADWLISTNAMVIFVAASAFVYSITTMISTSAMMRLYLDAGGASEA